MIDDVLPPRGFRQVQAVRLIGWKGESEHTGYQELTKALTNLLGPPMVDVPALAASQWPTLEQKITNIIGMEFVLIPAGTLRKRIAAEAPAGSV